MAGTPLPPGDVPGHHLVAEALGGGDRGGVVDVHGEELGGLGDELGVLHGPGVRVAAARGAGPGPAPAPLSLPGPGTLAVGDQFQGLLCSVGQSLSFRHRLAEVGEDIVDRAQSGVQLVKPWQRLRVGALYVAGHPGEEGVVDRRGAEVVAHEVDGAVGVAAVVVAHPRDEADEFLAVPGRVGQRPLGDPAGVALAGLQVLVYFETGGPAQLQGEGGEAFLLDQVAEKAFLQGEELVGAVGGFAEPHHLGVADH
ncbi:hypothetical protein SRIMM317S_05397 [Streptomyces rimosus subsp. rimosus]